MVARERGVQRPPSRTTDGCRGRIVVMDDDLMHLPLVERVLGDQEVIPVMQGRLGLELATAHRPDLVIVDPDLPDLPGEAILGRLRHQPATATTPVVVLSEEASPRRARRFLAAGAAAYFTKPLDVREFRRTVDEVLEVTHQHN